jgi:Raf kinase inhibitor-like YbhB/YbcL family protein
VCAPSFGSPEDKGRREASKRIGVRRGGRSRSSSKADRRDLCSGATVDAMAVLALLLSSFVLSSPAFAPGDPIPARYTCDGSDVSPPLRWTAPPRGTRVLALTVIDLDTRPPFRHWDLTRIPPRVRGLAAGSRIGHTGRNDFGRLGYGGPCPPRGQPHRYRFRLTAIATGGHVLARADLVAIYRRR